MEAVEEDIQMIMPEMAAEEEEDVAEALMKEVVEAMMEVVAAAAEVTTEAEEVDEVVAPLTTR